VAIPHPLGDPDRTLAEERAFLQQLPRRARLTVAQVGNVIAGFQIIEPYASYTTTMDHVATLGSYIVAPARGRGIGRVMSRDTLIDMLKGYERLPYDRSIDVRVTRLRRKIEDDVTSPVYIRTVWGEGYRFTPGEQ